MQKDDVVKRLTDYNEYADELISYTFKDKVQGSGWGIKWKKGFGLTSEYRGPDKEAISAISNKIGMLTKRNDLMSIHKMGQVYNDPLIQQTERTEFKKVEEFYNFVNTHLTPFKIEGETITYARVFEVINYGNVSHRTARNNDVCKTYDSWKATPFFAGLKNEFTTVLFEYLRCIARIAHINKIVLAQF